MTAADRPGRSACASEDSSARATASASSGRSSARNPPRLRGREPPSTRPGPPCRVPISPSAAQACMRADCWAVRRSGASLKSSQSPSSASWTEPTGPRRMRGQSGFARFCCWMYHQTLIRSGPRPEALATSTRRQLGFRQTRIRVPGTRAPRSGDHWPHSWVRPGVHSGSTRPSSTRPAPTTARTQSPTVRWCST